MKSKDQWHGLLHTRVCMVCGPILLYVMLYSSIQLTEASAQASTPLQNDLESTDTREHFLQHQWRAYTFSSVYMSQREQLNDRSYISGQGFFLNGMIELFRKYHSQVSLQLSYRAHLYEQTLTPTVAELEAGVVDANTSNITSLNRPESVDHDMGWRQRFSWGLNLHHIFNDIDAQVQPTLYSEMSGGIVYSKIKFNPLVPSTQIDKSKMNPWMCLRVHYAWLWVSLGYDSDPCIGYRDAQLRALMGLKLGRAVVGIGWGAILSEEATIYDDGGIMGYLLLPMSAPLYLEMSMWSPNLSSLSDSLGSVNGHNTSFSVGLKWTGETRSHELKATSPPSKEMKPSHLSPFSTPLSPGQDRQPTTPSQPL